VSPRAALKTDYSCAYNNPSPQRYSDSSKALANRLCEWLEATTSYVDLKEGLDRSWPNYDDTPKWQRFYQHGPVIMANESGILNAEGKATGFKIEIKSVAYDKEVQPGEIIQCRGGKRTGEVATRYMVQTNGSLKRI
jgi:hypothetical protein